MASSLAKCVRTSLLYTTRLVDSCPYVPKFRALSKDKEAQARVCARAAAGRPNALKLLFHVALGADRPDLLRLLFENSNNIYAFYQTMSYGHLAAYRAVACAQMLSGYHLNIPFSPVDAMFKRKQHLFHTVWCESSSLDSVLLVLCYKGTSDMPTALLEVMAEQGSTLTFELLRSLGAVWTRKAILDLHLDTREDLVVSLEAGLSEALVGYNDPRLWDHVISAAVEL